MLRAKAKKNKCRDIDYENDYKSFLEAASNPYDYNFGKRKETNEKYNYQKMQNKVNYDFISKNI